MADTRRDANRVITFLCVSAVNQTTPVPIHVNPATGAMIVEAAVGAANTGNVKRDSNRVPTVLGVSTTDGITIVPVQANPATGAMLVETT